MSRQMPLLVLADFWLNATMSSSEGSATARSASGANARGSKPFEPLARNAARCGQAHQFARDLDIHVAACRIRERVGDGVRTEAEGFAA